MSRNSSGTYSLPAGNPVVTNTVISSTWANSTLTDIATALTQSIASTGVTTPSANLPMGTFRHTGVGNATVKAAYSSVTDIQNGSLITLGAVSGSDTITATAPFTISSYAAGQLFQFIAAGTNSGAVTIDIDSVGAVSVTKNGAVPLAAGDITSGQMVQIVNDGTNFQLLTVSNAGLSVFNGSTSYNLATASGTVAITGVGFRPKNVQILGSIASTDTTSSGWGNGVASGCIYNNGLGGGGWTASGTNALFLVTGAVDSARGVISSLDADGFTITWTKIGSPTGSASIVYSVQR